MEATFCQWVEPAPQLANLSCYAREARFAEKMGENWKGWISRFIDDCFVAGDDFPSEEEYGMKYKQTSEDPNDLIFIGLRLFKDENGVAHSALYDRALEYPVQIKRYPWASTVAPESQLGGVLMGRFVACRIRSVGSVRATREAWNASCGK